MHRNVRNLYKGSGFSASTWGHQVCGLTKSNMELLERHGAKCSGVAPAGRCRFSANCVAYGQYGHPKARIIRETLGQEKDLRDAWMEAKAQHAKFGAASIRGPLSVVIDMLKSFGWTPLSYNEWHTHVPDTSLIINSKETPPKR